VTSHVRVNYLWALHPPFWIVIWLWCKCRFGHIYDILHQSWEFHLALNIWVFYSLQRNTMAVWISCHVCLLRYSSFSTKWWNNYPCSLSTCKNRKLDAGVLALPRMSDGSSSNIFIIHLYIESLLLCIVYSLLLCLDILGHFCDLFLVEFSFKISHLVSLYFLNFLFFHVQYFPVFDTPYNYTLLSSYDIVGYALVIWVQYKSTLL